MAAKSQIHLGFDLSYSHMGGRWRMPGAWPGRVFPDVEQFEDVARIAERGCLDFLFSGDGTGVPDTWRGSRDAAIRWGMNWPRQDFNPIMVAMSRVTKHIGFGLTYSSTFMHPYYLARLMNSLDHLTNGRIAMNLVTSTRRSDAANFGFDELMEHATRYERMEEFVDVCRKLWDSTEAGAMLWDYETGQVGDPAKIHDVIHAGKFFKVEGPLNTPPSPQGRPVIVQAGGSPRGIRASAYVADHQFGGDMALPLQVRQRAALDKALTELGRDPATMGILWQTPITVAETAAQAQAQRERLLTSIPAEAVGAYLAAHLKARGNAQWLAALHEADIPACPVNAIEDLFTDPHLTAVDFFERVEHPTEGGLTVCRFPLRFSGSPCEIRRLAPNLGEHNDEVLPSSRATRDDESVKIDA